MTIAEMAEVIGVSAHTLRYYERAGLIHPVDRTAGNQRRYSSDHLAWLEFLLRLRATGMPIRQMRVYAELRASGTETVQPRLDMLVEHQRQLRERIAELRRHDAALTEKITTYRTLVSCDTTKS